MTKLNLVIAALRQRITETGLQTGQVIPTQKELAVELKVAAGTVRQAMLQLQREGLVVSTRGRGTVIAAPRSENGNLERQTRVFGMLIAPGSAKDPVITPLMRSLQDACSTAGIELEVLPCLQLPSLQKLQTWAQNLDVIFVTGVSTPDFVNVIQAIGKPVIFSRELLAGTCPPWASQLSVDLENIASMAIQYLASLGHRHILLARDRGTCYMEGLGTQFAAAARHAGLSEGFHEVIVPMTSNGQEIVQALKESFPQTTAIVADGGMRSGRILHTLANHGYRVPKDISLLAINGVEVEMLITPDLSRIEHHVDREAQKILQMAEEVIKHRISIRATIPPHLVWGRTCAPLK